ncbi:hypothetical protein UFOVP20_39 [uncultured Caudovirales phage]|uniref:Uncharacterized protein n=1 Tax=uncultured Caudovirales phage TaxID=2100421 RepID=A0A6J5KPD5_9CAUD|nr:hypothetical protein UFOVP20_39 [uncultured Caudovirales phage]
MTDKDLFAQLLGYFESQTKSIMVDSFINQLKMRVASCSEKVTDKDKFLDHWTPTLGAEEALAAWENKQIAPGRQASMVMGDIQPYISQIDGSVINSRSQHRTHLRNNKCIEIGNEVQKPTAQMPTYDKQLKQRIIDVTNKRLGY